MIGGSGRRVAASVTLAALLALGAPAAAQNYSPGYKFLEAVEKKDIAEVEKLLGKPGSTLINSRDITNGRTALHIATQRRDIVWLVFLANKGANPNIADMAGTAALYAAVDMNSLQWVQGRPAPILSDRLDGVDLVGRLLQKGADPNARLKRAPLKRHHDAGSTMNFGEGATPLMRAARTNDVAVMKLLLDGGANPFLTLPDGTNALHIAAGQGFGGLRGEGIRIVTPTPEGAVDAVRLLLDRGMDVDAFNNAGQTALHASVNRGDAVVKLLVSRGARLLKNKAGFTPLDLALGQGGRGGRGGQVRETTAAILREYMAAAAKRN